MGVLGTEVAAAVRAAHERATGIAGHDAGSRVGRSVIAEGQLWLLELNRHGPGTYGAASAGWRTGSGSPVPPCRWDARKTVTDRAEKEPLASSEPSLEDAVDALEDGDRTVRTGTAMAALRHTTFRRVFIGAFLSNIGSWMQNVVLGALVYDLTGSATLVGVIVLAQLGPLLFFSLVGGLLADVFDRRLLLIVVSILQGLLSLVLALVARGDDPSVAALIAVTFLIGMGQAVFGPVYAALLPGLVGRDDLSGAVSLNSAQMNGSRVIGPVIGSLLFARYGAATVFVVNGATYLFVVGALLTVTLPAVVADKTQQGWRRLVAGFEVARRDYVVGRCLIIIFLFSLLSLTFVGQLPVLADENLGVDPRSTPVRAALHLLRARRHDRCTVDRDRVRRARPWPRSCAAGWSPSRYR